MIPFAAAIGAKVAGWTFRKVLPWLIIAGLALAFAGLWAWDAKTIDGLTAERDVAVTQLEIAHADARRWEADAMGSRASIARLNAEAEAARADLAQAEAILETADAIARAEAEDLNAEIRKWKERARANPQDVRPLGPIARDAYCHVMRGTGPLPAGCDPTD